MTEPVRLKNASDEPQSEVVEMLERALVEARAGRLRDVAIFGFLVGNETYSHFSTADMSRMAGGLSFLLFNICAQHHMSGYP